MQLRETEALGVFDDDDGGVGHVDPHLDDGGGDHDMGLAFFEALHLEGFLLGGELTVNHGGLVLRTREVALNHLEPVLKVAEVELGIVVDEGVDEINLASGIDLLLEEAEDERTAGLGSVVGAHGMPSRGQLVDDGAVEVAVEGHGEGTRNGSGGHHEDVGWGRGLAPQFGALFHAEAVLLVDDHECEVFEMHVVLDEGVGADENVDFAVGELLLDALLCRRAQGAGKQFDADGQPFKHA